MPSENRFFILFPATSGGTGTTSFNPGATDPLVTSTPTSARRLGRSGLRQGNQPGQGGGGFNGWFQLKDLRGPARTGGGGGGSGGADGPQGPPPAGGAGEAGRPEEERRRREREEDEDEGAGGAVDLKQAQAVYRPIHNVELSHYFGDGTFLIMNQSSMIYCVAGLINNHASVFVCLCLHPNGFFLRLSRGMVSCKVIIIIVTLVMNIPNKVCNPVFNRGHIAVENYAKFKNVSFVEMCLHSDSELWSTCLTHSGSICLIVRPPSYLAED